MEHETQYIKDRLGYKGIIQYVDLTIKNLRALINLGLQCQFSRKSKKNHRKINNLQYKCKIFCLQLHVICFKAITPKTLLEYSIYHVLKQSTIWQ